MRIWHVGREPGDSVPKVVWLLAPADSSAIFSTENGLLAFLLASRISALTVLIEYQLVMGAL
jgi:hypothetical protein